MSMRKEGDTGFNLFLGRYQPLHAGHCSLIRTVLNEGKKVCVAIRDTNKDEYNPFTLSERIDMFKKEFDKEIKAKELVICCLPDITTVCHGRKVGWKIREIKLDKKTEAISATKIRDEDKEVAERFKKLGYF